MKAAVACTRLDFRSCSQSCCSPPSWPFATQLRLRIAHGEECGSLVCRVERFKCEQDESASPSQSAAQHTANELENSFSTRFPSCFARKQRNYTKWTRPLLHRILRRFLSTPSAANKPLRPLRVCLVCSPSENVMCMSVCVCSQKRRRLVVGWRGSAGGTRGRKCVTDICS